jgi:hypothetical protein
MTMNFVVHGDDDNPECFAERCDCCERCIDCHRRTRGEFRPYGMCRGCVESERRAYEIEERIDYGAE